MLGGFWLEAHVGRLDPISKSLVCLVSVELLTHHASTSVKNESSAWQGPLVGRAELFPDSCRTMTAAFVFAHCVLDGLLLSSPLFHLTLEYKQCGRTTNKEGDIWPVMDDLSNSVYSISKGMCCILCVTVQTVYMKYCIKSSLILLLHVMV